ncbi:MAG: hypothetical protein NZ108_10010, partial [Bacteroidia bacterium]|nr:hypothetical protein [Bacteroidia bacterium]
PPVQPQPCQSGYRFQGILIRNEGQWNQNNASLTYLSKDGTWIADVFSCVNGKVAGDVAHSFTQIQDTLFLVMNQSRTIYKLQLPTLNLIGEIQLPVGASPRKLIYFSGEKAFVNSLLDGKIYLLNPATMILYPRTISVENYMEDMVLHNQLLWVSCGNYAYPLRNNKVAIVNPITEQVIRYVEMPIENPGAIQHLPDGRLAVACRGNYQTTNSCIAFLNPNQQTIDTVVYVNGYIYQMNQFENALWLLSDSAITRYSLTEKRLQYHYISRSRLGVRQQDLLYGIYPSQNTKQYYVLNAGVGAVNGTCLVLDSTFTPQKSIPCGVFPAEVLEIQ